MDSTEQKQSSKNWLQAISKSESAHKTWLQDAKDCWKRYTGETKQYFNIFKSTTDILCGALFNEMPKPDIRERFIERNTDNELKANMYLSVATVADRCVQYNNDCTDSKTSFNAGFKDAFITGRGVVKTEYDYNEDEENLDQKVPVKHVSYQMYVEEVCDREDEISWKGEIIPMTKKECAAEFNVEEEELGTSMQVEDVKGLEDFVKVYEIWDLKKKRRIYISPDYKKKEVLREDEDPLGLQAFFPYETYKTIDNGKNTLPTAEYNIYKTLNNELQDMVRRGGSLTKDHVVYRTMFDNAAGDDLKAAFNNPEGTAVPTNSKPQQGVLDMVGAIPTLEAQNIVNFLSEKAQEKVEQIWQVTGVSDIMRGQSDARETATAQKIKGVFGSLRIQPRQESVQELIKKIFRKQAEIVCEKFTTEQMQRISCIDLPTEQEKMSAQQHKMMFAQSQTPQGQQAIQMGMGRPVPPMSEEEESILDQPTLEQVAGVLRDDKMRGYSIDIETTATIFDDIATQREQIQSFTETLFGMIQQTAEFVARSPAILDLMEQMTLLNISQYKISRGYVDSIKGAFKKVKQEMSAPQPEAPDPAMLKLKQDQAKVQMDAQAKQQDNQMKMMEMRNKDKELDLRMMQENKKIALDAQAQHSNEVKDQADIRNDMANTNIKQQDANRKDRELEAETAIAVAEIQTGITTSVIAGDVGQVG